MRRSHKYWKNKKVLYVRPWPFFGFVAPTLVRYRAYPWVLQNVYNVFPEQRYFGLYQFVTPYLMIKNPDLVATIAINDVETFPCHRTKIDPESDPIYAKLLFSMKAGEQWKESREILKLALSGNKLKNSFRLMQECSKDFVNYFSKEGAVEVELKDISAKFANDVIAAVFGYKCNSLENPSNDFYLTTKYVTEFHFLRAIKYFLYKLSPRMMKFFKFSLVDNRTRLFFHRLIQKNRLSQNSLNFSKRPCSENFNEDCFLVKNNGKLENSDDDILAQAIQFLFFDFKTVSTVLLFAMYEISQNIKVQEKLIREIDKVRKEVSYESLTGIEYLDMVVAETVRKWPPTITTDRKLDKSFTIESTKPWEETQKFDADTLCLIPIFALHRDPKYFPNPDVFDPERFNAQNKKHIKPFTYIPFGVGARNCVGSEFALIQIKIFLFNLLSRFRLVKSDKSKDVITLSKTVFRLVPEGQVWINFEPRRNEV
ncbi:hypothetical protein RN001_008708 [Aquatica leii]|uniref:Cytochrome P450 n=1 Tax=Aquatica leii TaxID=1421715 RepID=A0AAN7SH12_9COLE|nr:hypothetical protein RN001_008708 [Aquatica leii]